jgi:hypothetical protein
MAKVVNYLIKTFHKPNLTEPDQSKEKQIGADAPFAPESILLTHDKVYFVRGTHPRVPVHLYVRWGRLGGLPPIKIK